MRVNSIAEEHIVFCGCTFAEGNTVTPRQAPIWHDGDLVAAGAMGPRRL